MNVSKVFEYLMWQVAHYRPCVYFSERIYSYRFTLFFTLNVQLDAFYKTKKANRCLINETNVLPTLKNYCLSYRWMVGRLPTGTMHL